VAIFVWPAVAQELVYVGRVLKGLGFVKEIDLILLLDVKLGDDAKVGLGITIRYRAFEILLA
jgi:hypothetical protein